MRRVNGIASCRPIRSSTPARCARDPWATPVEVDADEIPDLVLEVDLTTDVRSGKLDLYEAWGFPEVWVEVPENLAPSRPNRKPGLAIYLLSEDGYVQAPESIAFPGWTAAEIHAGMNEARTASEPISDATAAVLHRVGEVIRENWGTSPDNDPFMRMARAESRAEGMKDGLADGRIEGRVETLKEAVEGVLTLRGLDMSDRIIDAVEQMADLPVREVVRVAAKCQDEDDFIRRIILAPVE